MYKTAMQRSSYLADRYGRFLYGKILDVGSGVAYKDRDSRSFLDSILKGMCEEYQYYGIDREGRPSAIVNLESGGIPFQSNSFDCSVCSEVLEHLSCPSTVFREVVRVTRHHIIISLPNCWAPLFSRMVKGKREGMHLYGLPVESPNDRHKWFFNYSEGEAFVHHMANELDLRVIECTPIFGYSNKKARIAKWFLRQILAEEHFINLFSSNLWAVLKIKSQNS